MTTKIQVFFVLSLFYSKVTDLRIEGENLQLRQFFLCISISHRERLFSSHSRWKRKRHVQNVDIKTPVKGYLKNCVIFLIETTFRGLIELPNNIAIELHFLWKMLNYSSDWKSFNTSLTYSEISYSKITACLYFEVTNVTSI